jgi:hypothetical protein
VAGECALKSAISKMKGTRCGIGSLGKKEGGRAALQFGSPCAEEGATSGGAQRGNADRAGGDGSGGGRR